MADSVGQLPLTNGELEAYHEQIGNARQSYDPDQSETYIRPDTAWAYHTSDEFVHHRIRHATEEVHHLVTKKRSKEHVLAIDSLTTDFDRMSRYVKEDVNVLTEVMSDPAKVRESWWSQYDRDRSAGRFAWLPSKDRASNEPLSMEEARIVLDDLHPGAAKNEDEAIRAASVGLTIGLLENWKRKYYRGAKMPEEKDIPLVLELSGVGPSHLGRHLASDQARQGIEQEYRSVHRTQVAKLGRAATDAAGVRRALTGEPKIRADHEGVPATRAQRVEQLETEEIAKVMKKPVAVRSTMQQMRGEFMRRIFEPAQQKFESDPSEVSRKAFDRAEAGRHGIRMLYRYISRWESQIGDDGGFASLGDYMSDQLEQYNSEVSRYSGVRMPDDVNRRMNEFESADSTFRGSQRVTFMSTLQHDALRFAQQAA